MLKPEIDATAIKELRAELKRLEPGLERKLGTDTKKALTPYANRIQGFIPQSAPLSGMMHGGRTKYSPARVKVATRFGSGWGKPFALFSAEGAAGANAAAKITEFAGTRGDYKSGMSKSYYKNGKKVSHRLNGQGRAMVRGLERSPRAVHPKDEGRYFFQGYRANKPGMLDAIQKVIDKYIDKASERLS